MRSWTCRACFARACWRGFPAAGSVSVPTGGRWPTCSTRPRFRPGSNGSTWSITTSSWSRPWGPRTCAPSSCCRKSRSRPARRTSCWRSTASSADGYAVVIPGSAQTSKCWPAERFAALVDRLTSEHGLAVVATGTQIRKRHDREDSQLGQVSARQSREPDAVAGAGGGPAAGEVGREQRHRSRPHRRRIGSAAGDDVQLVESAAASAPTAGPSASSRGT